MPEDTSLADRNAEARFVVYGLFSQLVASPFDAPSPVEALPPVDLPELAEPLQARLPYSFDLRPLARVAASLEAADAEGLAIDYSGLFEVGSSGAPVPLREELSATATDKAKEETLRFYDHFGYSLTEDRQWAPDHLSVQLEFMHFLSFKESQEEDPEHLASYRLGQRDYLERHLCRWVPPLLASVEAQAKERYWVEVLSALATFLNSDAAWLRQRLAETD